MYDETETPVVDLSLSKKQFDQIKLETVRDTIREDIQRYAKHFKTAWLNLGRHLFAVYQDKMYHAWGFEKFEDYTEKELGLPKGICQKLLKAYLFVEQQEPAYLEADFARERDAVRIPPYEAIDVLRLAKSKKELLAEDYQKLRHDVFDRGIPAAEVRKDLTAIIKERKPVDPEEEREKRQQAVIKKFLSALDAFKKDARHHMLVTDEVLDEIDRLKKRLQS